MDRVFDLSLSIDLHRISTAHTLEEAVAGTTTGLIGLHETVTWKAKHFGKFRLLTTQITEMHRPLFFADEMVWGDFKAFRHEHRFEKAREGTLMTDRFDYTSPYGLIGRLADFLFLKAYMKRLLLVRNETIRDFAENGRWREVLPDTEPNCNGCRMLHGKF